MRTTILLLLALGLTGGLVFWLTRPAPQAQGPAIEAPRTTAPAPEPAAPAPVRSPNHSPTPVATLAESALPAPAAIAPAARPAPRAAVQAPAAAVVPMPVVADAPGSIPPAALVENMRTTVRQYGLMFGGNPVGTNEEITKALDGDNPKHVKFLGPDGNRVNGQGELVDSWGTPYFFHQVSGTEMEVRSAGPDHVMWTGDDLVVK